MKNNTKWILEVALKTYKKRNNISTRNNHLFNGKRENGEEKRLSHLIGMSEKEYRLNF
tara:strand:+ start:328 stop:501 length:174 start_codon:yes stop_codon:yes gene_type:complete